MDQKRYAYLISANGPQSQYQSHLKFAEVDARRLADAFITSPCSFFHVESMIAVEPFKAITDLELFSKQCEPADLLVIYISGYILYHASYEDRLFFLCNGTNVDNLIDTAIDLGLIKSILMRCQSNYKLLVLDCCYISATNSYGFSQGTQGLFERFFQTARDFDDVLFKIFQGSDTTLISSKARSDRTRELSTLDGGSGFLTWVIVSSCTTCLKEVSPDGVSLSLFDIWEWLPRALNDVNKELNENERIPHPIFWREMVDTRVIWLTPRERKIPQEDEYVVGKYNKERRLKMLMVDHRAFLHDRLDSFVGRARELEEIRQRIHTRLRTGGYITIIGRAGLGKSSIIAKLIELYQKECGTEGVVFHFIPFNPGPDHQVSLLRNLMSRLIHKYDLSDLFVASEGRAALRDYLPKVLAEVVTKGGKEVIFIDGLDQLEEEFSGMRDLSFVPSNPPPGVVFVLGTRPDDALRPLELLKHNDKYQLLRLSREDFDLVLAHRQVSIDRTLADQIYEEMQGNALYLDLAAQELSRGGAANSAEIIKSVADNPENLFSLSIGRLKQQRREWEKVIKPILGILLVAREPLTAWHIRQMLAVESDELREGLYRLGGLLEKDAHQRYSLFHPKLYNYLRQDEDKPQKDYIFSTDEEQDAHKTIVDYYLRKVGIL